MKNIYLSLSTNLGDRHQNLQSAKAELEKHNIKILQESDIFETEPWGLTDQPWYLNQCLEVETEKSPEKLLLTINNIESLLGRVREKKYGPRLIDIDILLYESAIMDTHKLQIPHPKMHERNFVLVPLNQIASNLTHPKLNKKISELKVQSKDTLKTIQNAG